MSTALDIYLEYLKLDEVQQDVFLFLFAKKDKKSTSVNDLVTKERFANGYVCPLCGSVHIYRNGKRKDGTQRYFCKD